MKTLLLILIVLSVVPVSAQTYTTEEFIVTGEPAVVQPGTTTVTTTTTGPGTHVVPGPGAGPGPGPATVIPPGPEAPIYVGMNKHHVIESMGHPTHVERFRRFAGRHQGIYDEVWTYQTPTGTTFVYIKERRVLRIEYR